MPKLRPINDQVLIRRDKPIEQIGSIVLSAGEQETRMSGEVIAVGNGPFGAEAGRREPHVLPGDRVMFRKFAGVELPKGALDPDHEYVLCYESDVMGILFDEAAAPAGDPRGDECPAGAPCL